MASLSSVATAHIDPLHQRRPNKRPRVDITPGSLSFQTKVHNDAEEAFLAQAIQNSLDDVQHPPRRQVVKKAPHFFPTIEEFADPIGYMTALRDSVANRSGICVIHPPKGWDPTCEVLSRHDAHTTIFDTKLQRLRGLAEGEVMGDGKVYTLPSYHQMADKFTREWCQTRHPEMDASPLVSSGTLGEAGFSTSSKLDSQAQNLMEALEDDYWKLTQVSSSTSEGVTCEYASDLGCGTMPSGFPLRQEKQDPPVGKFCDKGGAFGSNEFYRQCGWNLNNLPKWPRSLLQWIDHDVDGINRPWLYLGMLFATFCWHVEDLHLSAVSYLHAGASKQWYGVPASQYEKFQEAMQRSMRMQFSKNPELMHSITTQIDPATLSNYGVPVYSAVQTPGTFILSFPRCFHSGFSYGFNVGEAVNVALPDWLPYGAQAMDEYRFFSQKKEIFSFERFLFTLGLSAQTNVANVPPETNADLFRLQKDISKRHLQEREECLSYGVQLFDQQELLPPAGRLSKSIGEAEAEYDDARLCHLCSHTCFFACVCCPCNQENTSCLRCYQNHCEKSQSDPSHMFLIEWLSPTQIHEHIEGVRSSLCRKPDA